MIRENSNNFVSTLIAVLLLTKSAASLTTSHMHSSPPPIVACKSASEVAQAISKYVQHEDTVLELGALLSSSSAHLCRTIGSNGKAVLVDVKRKDAASGRSSNRRPAAFSSSPSAALHQNEEGIESFVDRVLYRELEYFEKWRELCGGEHHYHVVVLDISSIVGNDLHLSALTVANEFIVNQKVPPRAIIIKSKALSCLARKILHSQRLLDGTIFLPKQTSRSPDPIIIPCVGVNDYRKTIPLVVKQGDDVIEVGCHFGTTTALLHKAAVQSGEGTESEHVTRLGFCAGVDIGEKIIENAKTKYQGPVFEVANAWNTLDLLKVKERLRNSQHLGSSDALGYDVVYADIGGLSGAHGLLESLSLLDSLSKALEPRCIVIKSLCMKRLASQLIAFSSVQRKVYSTKENS